MALLLSVIAIIVSIAAICISCPHIPELGFDYQGVLIGVLSLLITTLTIFFTFSYLTVERRIKHSFELKMKESFKDFETKTVIGILSEQYKIIDIFRNDFIKRKDLGSYVTIIIVGLEMAVRIKQQDTIDLSIDALIDVYSETELAKTLDVKQQDIDKLFLLLDDLSGRKVHILLGLLELVYNSPCNKAAIM